MEWLAPGAVGRLSLPLYANQINLGNRNMIFKKNNSKRIQLDGSDFECIIADLESSTKIDCLRKVSPVLLAKPKELSQCD